MVIVPFLSCPHLLIIWCDEKIIPAVVDIDARKDEAILKANDDVGCWTDNNRRMSKAQMRRKPYHAPIDVQ